MTTTPIVGEADPAGADGQPVQPVSQADAKPIEGDAIKLLTELGGKYDTLVKELRGLQGRQDKSEKSVNDFQGQLARYTQYTDRGLKPDEALAEMQRVDADAQWRQSLETKLDNLAGR